jgi:hypothetical protein
MASANRTSTLEKGYIENNATGSILRFQYNPEEFSDSQTIEYRAIKSPGISYPVYQYVGGEVRTISLTLFLDNMETTSSTNKVKETIDFLNNFLPTPNRGTRYAPPPSMTFGFGWFVKECLLIEMNTRYTMFDRKLQPLRAEVELSIQVVQ